MIPRQWQRQRWRQWRWRWRQRWRWRRTRQSGDGNYDDDGDVNDVTMEDKTRTGTETETEATMAAATEMMTTAMKQRWRRHLAMETSTETALEKTTGWPRRRWEKWRKLQRCAAEMETVATEILTAKVKKGDNDGTMETTTETTAATETETTETMTTTETAMMTGEWRRWKWRQRWWWCDAVSAVADSVTPNKKLGLGVLHGLCLLRRKMTPCRPPKSSIDRPGSILSVDFATIRSKIDRNTSIRRHLHVLALREWADF